MPNPEYNEVHFLLRNPLTSDQKAHFVSRLDETADYTVSDPRGQDPSHVRTRAASGELDCRVDVVASEVGARLTDKSRDGLPDMPSLRLRVHNIIFSQRHSDESERQQYRDELIDLVVDVTEILGEVADEPLYVILAGNTETEDIRSGREDLSREAVESGQLEEVYWGQILTQQYIDKLGEKTLLSAPAYRVEELPSDSLLLISRESPIHYDTSQQDLREYLLSGE